jgi:hypothetical protein
MFHGLAFRQPALPTAATCCAEVLKTSLAQEYFYICTLHLRKGARRWLKQKSM